MLVGKWKDKRTVLYISTEFENDMVSITNKRGQQMTKPLPIVQYNAHMKGVDRMDQMLAYYPCERKTLRWNLKIFVHVLQMFLVNAYHLHNMYTTGSKLSLYDFRLKLLEQMLPPKDNVARAITPQRGAAHRIAKSQEQDARGGTKRKRCRQCFKTEPKEKRTMYFCEVCPDQPGLCPGKCFDTYHKDITN